MKTFKDLKVGDVFFDCVPENSVINETKFYVNTIIDVLYFDNCRVYKWEDDEGGMGNSTFYNSELDLSKRTYINITSIADVNYLLKYLNENV